MRDWRYEPAKDLDLPAHERLRSVRRESGLAHSAMTRAATIALRAYFTLYHRLRIEGRGNMTQDVRDGPVVFVANHSSHLDALVLAAALPWALRRRVLVIAAGELFFASTARAALSAALLNALPMWRRKPVAHALADLRQRLTSGRAGFILFPEGGRARTPEMTPFKAGIGMLVAGTPARVIPCAIEGAFEAMPPDARLPRPRAMRVRFGEACSFADAPNDRAGWELVARTLEERVRALRQTAPTRPRGGQPTRPLQP